MEDKEYNYRLIFIDGHRFDTKSNKSLKEFTEYLLELKIIFTNDASFMVAHLVVIQDITNK